MGIVDTDGAACVTAAFSFGMDTATRNYRIHAIQYDRLNEMGGPAGCLQFFTGATGTVNTFNWVAVATSTHLANQDYDVCVRLEKYDLEERQKRQDYDLKELKERQK